VAVERELFVDGDHVLASWSTAAAAAFPAAFAAAEQSAEDRLCKRSAPMTTLDTPLPQSSEASQLARWTLRRHPSASAPTLDADSPTLRLV
jgi:hypothetical protein